MENNLYYTLSTMAQTLGALLAVGAAFVVARLQTTEERLQIVMASLARHLRGTICDIDTLVAAGDHVAALKEVHVAYEGTERQGTRIQVTFPAYVDLMDEADGLSRHLKEVRARLSKCVTVMVGVVALVVFLTSLAHEINEIARGTLSRPVLSIAFLMFLYAVAQLYVVLGLRRAP